MIGCSCPMGSVPPGHMSMLGQSAEARKGRHSPAFLPSLPATSPAQIPAFRIAFAWDDPRPVLSVLSPSGNLSGSRHGMLDVPPPPTQSARNSVFCLRSVCPASRAPLACYVPVPRVPRLTHGVDNEDNCCRQGTCPCPMPGGQHRFERTLPQRRYTDGKYAHAKAFSAVSHQGNAN